MKTKKDLNEHIRNIARIMLELCSASCIMMLMAMSASKYGFHLRNCCELYAPGARTRRRRIGDIIHTCEVVNEWCVKLIAKSKCAPDPPNQNLRRKLNGLDRKSSFLSKTTV